MQCVGVIQSDNYAFCLIIFCELIMVFGITFQHSFYMFIDTELYQPLKIFSLDDNYYSDCMIITTQTGWYLLLSLDNNSSTG